MKNTTDIQGKLAQLKSLDGYGSHSDTRLEAWGLYNTIQSVLCSNGLAGQGSEGQRLIEEARLVAQAKSLAWYLSSASVFTGGGSHGESDLLGRAKTLEEHVEGVLALVEGARRRMRAMDVTFSRDVFTHYVGEEKDLGKVMKAYLMEVYQDHIKFVRGGFSSYGVLCSLAQALHDAVKNGITNWTELGITPQEVQAGLDRQMRQDALFCVWRLEAPDEQDEEANCRPDDLRQFIEEALGKGVVSQKEIDALYLRGALITRQDVCDILGYEI